VRRKEDEGRRHIDGVFALRACPSLEGGRPLTDLGEDDGHPFRRLVRLRLIWLLAGGVAAITLAILGLVVALDGDDCTPAGSDSVQNDGRSSGGSTPTVSPTPTPLAAELTESPVEAEEFREAPAGFTPSTPGEVLVTCNAESSLDAVFAWSPSEPEGTEQRLEIDFSGQKFVSPPFFSSQVLDPDISSLGWNLPAGFIFSWRVITKLNGDWVAGDPANVFTAACPPLDHAQ